MKKFLFGTFVIILTGCHDSDGNFSSTNSFILIVVVVVFLYFGAKQSKELSIKKEIQDKDRNSFEDEFYAMLKDKNVIAANCVIRSPQYGLAISDSKDKIIVFTSKRIMHIIPKEKIYSCELSINNKTIVTTKSKMPIASWNTLENTRGTMTDRFQNAILKITVDDLETPFFKLTFSDLEIAEKYDALVRLVLSKK